MNFFEGFLDHNLQGRIFFEGSQNLQHEGFLKVFKPLQSNKINSWLWVSKFSMYRGT